jgi:hypothetical protein
VQLFDVAEATVVIVLVSPALLLSAQPISRIIMPLTGCYGWPAALHTHSHTVAMRRFFVCLFFFAFKPQRKKKTEQITKKINK